MGIVLPRTTPSISVASHRSAVTPPLLYAPRMLLVSGPRRTYHSGRQRGPFFARAISATYLFRDGRSWRRQGRPLVATLATSLALSALMGRATLGASGKGSSAAGYAADKPKVERSQATALSQTAHSRQLALGVAMEPSTIDALDTFTA